MSKLMLGLFMISTFMLAGVKTANATPELVQSGITIIDIRTEPEWVQTGIIKDSIPITFFDARGNYDAEKFLDTISKYVNKGEEFALICRTGNRTTAVSDFLGKQGYDVINLKGGVVSLEKQGFKLVPYTK
ncbi:MAG TPA: rhodanese-like domain-containing protein [Sulfurospirillum arcachonense]|nr:rhodanese-like domain-containing protein [Sulfurospirillum arcachonense]